MVRRSSRSSPASRTSCSEPSGSASLATAIRYSFRTGERTLPFRLEFAGDGQAVRLVEGGATPDARRLGRLLPALRARAALLRREGARRPRRLPAVRRGADRPLPRLRR